MTVIPWTHTTNLGFAFNRSTWREILKCANTFCTYDDYNWDYSLHHISQSCMSQKLFTMIPSRARAFHIGIWYFLPILNNLINVRRIILFFVITFSVVRMCIKTIAIQISSLQKFETCFKVQNKRMNCIRRV